MLEPLLCKDKQIEIGTRQSTVAGQQRDGALRRLALGKRYAGEMDILRSTFQNMYNCVYLSEYGS